MARPRSEAGCGTEAPMFSLRSAGAAANDAASLEASTFGSEDEGEMDKPAPDPLRAIRDRIDAIDEAVHRLLIDRSGVIAELIQVKGTSKPGAAFRPDREADMMRRLVMRHSGELPLATVEHIWREIITSFTAMQAPFGVVTGPAVDPLAMRDLVRFYFGFSVPVSSAETNEQAIAEVASVGKKDRSRGGRRIGPMVGRARRRQRAKSVRKAPLHRNSRPTRRPSRLRDRAAAQGKPRARRQPLRHPRCARPAGGDRLVRRRDRGRRR